MSRISYGSTPLKDKSAEELLEVIRDYEDRDIALEGMIVVLKSVNKFKDIESMKATVGAALEIIGEELTNDH